MVSRLDRKSTRLNSSHLVISYAVFCLKKKTNTQRGRPLDAGRGRALPAPFPRLGPAAPPERRAHRHLLERGPAVVLHRLRGERLDVHGARGSAHAHWGAAEDFSVLFRRSGLRRAAIHPAGFFFFKDPPPPEISPFPLPAPLPI